MTTKAQKILFYAYPHPTAGIVFNDWTKNWIRWYWAGGKTNKKFILKKLVEKHWIKLGAEIYKAYNQALLEIMDSGYTDQKTAVMTFYIPPDENYVDVSWEMNWKV